MSAVIEQAATELRGLGVDDSLMWWVPIEATTGQPVDRVGTGLTWKRPSYKPDRYGRTTLCAEWVTTAQDADVTTISAIGVAWVEGGPVEHAIWSPSYGGPVSLHRGDELTAAEPIT